jgi:hypothetical protein
MPPSFWRAARRRGDTLLIGTNRVLAFRALRAVRWDALVIRDTYHNLWHRMRWGVLYHERLWKPNAAWKVGPSFARVTHCDEFVRQAPGWQHQRAPDRNGEAAVVRNDTVALMAANWAWLQGAREIDLVGVDYAGGHASMIPPYDGQSPGWEGQYAGGPREVIEEQFARAVEAVRAAGGTLHNLSPGTRLRAVPRAVWR